MTSSSGRVEVNLCRLLSRCEMMASENNCPDWRLEKYISTLYEFMAQLRKLNANGPPAEMLSDYARRIDLLRGISEAKKLSSAADRSQAVDLLIPSNQTMSNNASSRDLHAVTKARYHKEMREELLSKDGNSAVRQRTAGDKTTSDDGEVNELIRHHAEVQERIAEEMVQLARNLKENVQASGHIVREDVQHKTELDRDEWSVISVAYVPNSIICLYARSKMNLLLINCIFNDDRGVAYWRSHTVLHTWCAGHC